MRIFFMVIINLGIISCSSKSQNLNNQSITQNGDDRMTHPLNTSKDVVGKIEKSDIEWKSLLTDQEYFVLRQEGTERPGSSKLLKENRHGVYKCKACNLELFFSTDKYDSGTGWPSFFDGINSHHLIKNKDYKLGYLRTEIECARCNGHLGHVFEDGPKPTGLRYCINGLSLDFEELSP